jgi:hypothetical protein
MGLFSDRRRLLRPARLPIRLHSEFAIGQQLARGGHLLQRTAAAACNDARIVGAILVIAAAGLAVEMAASFK